MATTTEQSTLTYAEAAYLVWLEWEEERHRDGAPAMMAWDEMSESFRRLLVLRRHGHRVSV
ncbi:hypothetical protein [Georgenia subflava]|uniref:Uncharacterized protein n=1 Tax=Georgenia subflava TaxID=1622177 RepID=A0A6N7EF74_9MICO|nr:hypothetical protein [Georgenia subflava]MPV36759.1 hypothetical protein [Georgenia subflava]